MEGGLSCWESSGEITPLQRDARSRRGGRAPKAGRELEWDVSRLALRARGSWARICWDLCRGDGAGVALGGCMEGQAPCLGWECWWLWMPVGKVLVLGHQKVSPT